MDLMIVAQDVTWGGRTGDAIHVRELARHLAARGHRVRVLVRGGDDVPPAGVHVYPLRSRHNLALAPIRQPLVVRELLHLAREQRPDLIYTRSFGDIAESRIAGILGIPIVFEVNGDAIAERESQRGRLYSRFQRAWQVRCAKAGFRRARLVVAVTPTLRDRLAKEYGVPAGRLRVVPNGADLERFRPMPRTEARRRLGLPEDAPIVGFVGNLTPWQGVDFLIRAFPIVADRHTGAKLLVVGDGKARDGLESLAAATGIAGKVVFAGAVPYEDVPIYVAAMDVCTAPMTRERLKSGSSAVKIHEYLSCGRPVVASRIPGLEFVETEHVGRLVPPEDSGALAAALDEILRDETWRRSAGSRGRVFVETRAGWPSVAASVEDVCREAVGA